MPPPSTFAVLSGPLARLRRASLGGAEAWLSEWAVLSVDGYLHLFPCANARALAEGASPPEHPSLSLECRTGAIRSVEVETRLMVEATARPLWARLSSLVGWQPEAIAYEFDAGTTHTTEAGPSNAGAEAWAEAFAKVRVG
mmetsp:Transcript_48948/g.144647  ORF Transcript_48948/g.144647 Transcript_48948/m.144647 type:complete len:141 (+) Transcript_48948:3-425(+)